MSLAAVLVAAKAAGAFVRRYWPALAAAAVLAASFRAGCVVQARLDAGDLRAAKAHADDLARQYQACADRVGEYAAGEAGYQRAIADLEAGRDERARELAASVARTAALEQRQRDAVAELLASHAARRDAEARATTARYQATEAWRAIDELLLRWLAADPAAPPGLAADLRAKGYGERTVSGGGP